MVIKVYISGISGNKEVKKRQQRVLLILDSKSVKYEVIDIAEPGAEESKDFMQNNSTSLGGTISDPSPRHPLPPQIFNDEEYCGDYDLFDMANEIDEMEKFLKLEAADSNIISNAEIKLKNGEVAPDEEAVKDDEKEAAEKTETKENAVLNEQDKKESGEELKEEDVKENAESKVADDSQDDAKATEEPTEIEESNDEGAKQNAESKIEDEEDDVAGGGDEHGEKEEDEETSSKLDEEKAETA